MIFFPHFITRQLERFPPLPISDIQNTFTDVVYYQTFSLPWRRFSKQTRKESEKLFIYSWKVFISSTLGMEVSFRR